MTARLPGRSFRDGANQESEAESESKAAHNNRDFHVSQFSSRNCVCRHFSSYFSSAPSWGGVFERFHPGGGARLNSFRSGSSARRPAMRQARNTREAERRPAGGRPSGAACAKRGPTGQMQTPAELVPVRNGPQCGVKAP